MMGANSIWRGGGFKDGNSINLVLNNGDVASGTLRIGKDFVMINSDKYIPGKDFQGVIYKSSITEEKSLVVRGGVAGNGRG